MEPTIKCPDCGKEIKLTDAMAAPLLAAARKEFEGKLQATVKWEVEKSRRESAERVSELEGKLGEAQAAQAEYVRKNRELDDARREIDLTIEKKVTEGQSAIREQASKEARDSMNLTLRQGEEREAKLKQQLEEMQLRLQQGSQQSQGEILELEIENRLRSVFPQDLVTPVPKGEFGGDLLQKILGATADPCGSIIWELKRTKTWSDSWLGKLRADQRAAKADAAIIVSYARPKDIEVYDLVDGVWVCAPNAFIPLSMALREALIDVRSAKRSMDGMRTKAEQVYEYLTGPRFKQRVSAIIEFLSVSQKDLDAEKKAMQRVWSKRQEGLERVATSTAGMYGDLQAIAGATLEEIPGMTLEAIAAPGTV